MHVPLIKQLEYFGVWTAWSARDTCLTTEKSWGIVDSMDSLGNLSHNRNSWDIVDSLGILSHNRNSWGIVNSLGILSHNRNSWDIVDSLGILSHNRNSWSLWEIWQLSWSFWNVYLKRESLILQNTNPESCLMTNPNFNFSYATTFTSKS